MLSRRFELKKEEVTGAEEYDDQVKEDEMGDTCSTYREVRNICGISISKPEDNKPLGITFF